MTEVLLTVRDAAAEFRVPARTIETWIHRGKLPSYGGLVLADDVADVECETRRRPRLAALLAAAQQETPAPWGGAGVPAASPTAEGGGRPALVRPPA